MAYLKERIWGLRRKEREDSGYYEWDTGFGNYTKRDSIGKCFFKEPRFGKKSELHVVNQVTKFSFPIRSCTWVPKEKEFRRSVRQFLTCFKTYVNDRAYWLKSEVIAGLSKNCGRY